MTKHPSNIKAINGQNGSNRDKTATKNNYLFYFAIALIPFENFIFAPSTGWAAISPLLFAAHLILKRGKIKKSFNKYKKLSLIAIIGLLTTFLNALFQETVISNLIGALISITLGVMLLLDFDIYYEENKKNIKKEIKKVAKILTFSYLIVIILGCLEYLAAQKGINELKSLFHIISKRDYLLYNRVQFFYTEPSFIGMHIFGIILPVFLISKERKLFYALTLHIVTAVIFSSSTRFFIDIIVVAIIFLYYIIAKKKLYLFMAIIPIAAYLLFSIATTQNYRFNLIAEKGIYADGSLAARYFRINASVKGYKKHPVHTVIGWGIGNALIPLREGYNEARLEYDNSFTKEVDDLGRETYTNDSVAYSLPIRIISEYGLIIFLILLGSLIVITKKSTLKYKWPLLLSIIYIYLQFESLAFYSIWLFVVMTMNTRTENCKPQRRRT